MKIGCMQDRSALDTKDPPGATCCAAYSVLLCFVPRLPPETRQVISNVVVRCLRYIRSLRTNHHETLHDYGTLPDAALISSQAGTVTVLHQPSRLFG